MPRLLTIFVSLLFLMLLLVMAWDAPISGDEEVHFDQAKKNLAYFRSLGTDTAALHTPITHLRDYGQSFDNLTTLVVQLTDLKNPYRFRHLANAVVTWGILVLCGLLLWHLTGNRWAALGGMVLLFISPRFVGHGLNNLKDIPFAFGYMLALYAMIRLLSGFPNLRKRHVLFLVAGIASAISIRVGGILLICYFWAFALFRWYDWYVQTNPSSSYNRKILLRYALVLLMASAGGYFAGLIFWPYGVENPIVHPWISLKLMHDYPTTVRQIFEGQLYWSERFPWYYALQYIWITVPLPVLVGLIALATLGRKVVESKSFLSLLFVLIAAGFPLFYAIASGANLYGGWRQLLFIYPPLLVAAAYGLYLLWSHLQGRWQRWGLLVLLVVSSYSAVRHLMCNYPYYTIYFNALAGGSEGAYGRYEWDYYFTGFKEAYEKLYPLAAKDLASGKEEVRVATNFLIHWYFDTTKLPIKPVLVDYYQRGYRDWDYAIFCNTFIHPYQLQHSIWPPSNTVAQVKMGNKPVSIVLRRNHKHDHMALGQLSQNHPAEALSSAEMALQTDPRNESALLLKATAEAELQLYGQSLHTIRKLLAIYPGKEDAEDLMGEIYYVRGETERSEAIWRTILQNNYKYYHAYVNLSRAAARRGEDEAAVQWLRSCLGLNPFYKPAILALARLYTQLGEAEKARRYFERAKSL